MKRITRILRFLLTRLVDKRRVDHSLENRNGWTEKEYNEREEGWSDILEKPWSCRPTRAEERTGVFLSFLFERCNTLHRELNLPPRSIEIWKRDCIHVCRSCAFACDPRIRGQLKLAGRHVSSRKWQLMSSNRSENIEPCGFEADLINPPGSNASFRPLRTITRVPRTMPVRLRTEQNQTFAFPPASIILNWYQVELTWLIFTSLVFDRVNSVKSRVAIRDNAMLALDLLFLLFLFLFLFFFLFWGGTRE